ncbi:Uncharacterised protein [Acinetobacter baumannii]|nr:Uncharacterised protein [Acinetobacter baumannii]
MAGGVAGRPPIGWLGWPAAAGEPSSTISGAMPSSPGCSSGTSVGCTSTLGMAGDCGRGGASTTTWRDSSSRVNSIGRKITARAISTNAPTMRCFSPLSSKAMIYSPLSVLRASHSRPSATL